MPNESAKASQTVRLEFKRIQTYLFSSPRLRSTLGANAALGNTIRIELVKLARTCGAQAIPDGENLLPDEDREDPLAQAETDPLLRDDPARIYRENGVLVRDGGHFTAIFPTADGAQNFVQQAQECVARELPGILLAVRVNDSVAPESSVNESLFFHPAFQVSHYLGNRPASSRGAKGAFISAEEKDLEDRGRIFRENPKDLIAALEKSGVIPRSAQPAESFSDLVGPYPLALVHADGNGVGQRYQEWQKKAPSTEGLGQEVHGERFFHSMRVAVRHALVQALQQTFQDAPDRYQLPMLGGDDLLLACAAPYALPFVCAYARALEGLSLCDQKPLSIGAGIAIAKDTFPFYRLHAMAETLADSAKRRYRGNPVIGSVVDWHITANSWVEHPITERQADSIAGSTILSGKPYPVLGTETEVGLESLLKEVHTIKDHDQIARSQLRSLVEILRRGPKLAEMAYAELPAGMHQRLQDSLKRLGHPNLFHTIDGRSISLLPDLVDLYELGGANDNRPASAPESIA